MICPLCQGEMITRSVMAEGEFKYRCYSCSLTHNKMSIGLLRSLLDLDSISRKMGEGGTLHGGEILINLIQDRDNGELLEYYYYRGNVWMVDEWERMMKLKAFW